MAPRIQTEVGGETCTTLLIHGYPNLWILIYKNGVGIRFGGGVGENCTEVC